MGRFRDVELDELELPGRRLVLRPWRPEDAERVHAVLQDPAMGRYLAVPEPYTLEDARQFVADRAGRRAGTGLTCAMVERASGRVVGSCGLRLADDPEIGYWVAPDAQGHGYASESCEVLGSWLFGLGVARVRLACDVRNLASIRTALAAGFQFEGVGRNGLLSAGTDTAPERRADLARFARLAADPPGRIAPAFAALPSGGLGDSLLGLRTMQPQDAHGLIETDDELTLRWGFTGAGHTADEARRAAAEAGLDWLVGRVAVFTMVDVATGRLAGVLRLRKAGPPQVGGVGYVVHPDFRGRGYTTRALRLLVPWAFDVADFARLELGAKVGNEASLRAAAAAGFEADGVRRARLRNPDGTFSDEVRYALVNPRYA